MKKLVETLWINGKRVETDNIAIISNPSNITEQVGEIMVGSEEHVNIAVGAAEVAWKQWAKVSPEERATLMEKAANYIEENVDELAHLLVLEHGKVFNECKFEVMAGANILRYYASLKHHLTEDKVIENYQGKMVLTRQPIGVVSVIVPWNGPIVLGFLMIAPSLLAGNAVVVKPPMYCPLTLVKILSNIAKIFPEGVINVVTGSGSKVGNSMVKHPRVRKVAFTGSTEVGRDIMRNAADTVKNVSMELGGNDAAIVLEDATLDKKLIDEMVQGVFTMCGQICYGIKRIYVPRDKYTEFIEKFTNRADKIIVGPGLHPESIMGPINNKDQYEKIKKLIDGINDDQVEIRTVGKMAQGVSLTDGYYVLPTIVVNVRNSAQIVQDEQFGPVIPIIPYDSLDEAIEFANNTEFGLGNSIWTSDEEKAFKIAKQLQSGSVFINIHRMGASAVNMPFGGFKQSGIGRGHGVEGLLEHTELQAIIKRSDM